MSVEAYEVRQRKDHRGVDLISDALPFGRLWYIDIYELFANPVDARGGRTCPLSAAATNPRTWP
jgi:hypothetical protein